jgi:hypothetical protein
LTLFYPLNQISQPEPTTATSTLMVAPRGKARWGAAGSGIGSQIALAASDEALVLGRASIG